MMSASEAFSIAGSFWDVNRTTIVFRKDPIWGTHFIHIARRRSRGRAEAFEFLREHRLIPLHEIPVGINQLRAEGRDPEVLQRLKRRVEHHGNWQAFPPQTCLTTGSNCRSTAAMVFELTVIVNAERHHFKSIPLRGMLFVELRDRGQARF